MPRTECPYCDASVKLEGEDLIEVCSEGCGVLEGISDEEWEEIEANA